MGILNGVGDEWDPTGDQWIPSPYSNPKGKAPNTEVLRQRMGLADQEQVPILGIVSRMDEQKGFGLVAEAVPSLLEAGRIQMAVLGRGDPRVEELFSRLAGDFPGLVAFERAFDRGLGHLIEAGSHMFLMPSRFEPCGLNQMYSMAYGTVPIVHRTGGLADSVAEWDGSAGTGFLFEPHTAEAFGEALDRALAAFHDGSWPTIQANGMAGDYSWGARVAEYEVVYERAVTDRR